MSMTHKVLFISAGNAARSQMAEALLNKMSGGRYRAYSAGIEPSTVDERAIKALQAFNVPEDGLHSKPLHVFEGEEFDDIIMLCDKSDKECERFPQLDKAMRWNFKDPGVDGRARAFAKALQEIQQRLQMFVLVRDKEHH